MVSPREMWLEKTSRLPVQSLLLAAYVDGRIGWQRCAKCGEPITAKDHGRRRKDGEYVHLRCFVAEQMGEARGRVRMKESMGE